MMEVEPVLLKINAVLNVDVGSVVEHIEAAGHIQVKGLCHPVGLRDMLV